MIKTLKLYHYTNADIKGYIKPDFFGLNTYTKNSASLSDVKRSYFYIGKGKEYFLNGVTYRYTAIVEAGKIYDIDKDIKGFKNKNLKDILLYIKNLGYYGIRGNNGFDVVCLFKRIKYIDKKEI